MNRFLLFLHLLCCAICFSQEEQDIIVSNTYTSYYPTNQEETEKIKNGKWKERKVIYKVDDIKLDRKYYIDENNQIVRDFTTVNNYEDNNKTINHARYGKVFNSKTEYYSLNISQLSKTPSLTKPSENDTYYGFYDIGTYEDESGYTFIGFMLPMQTQFGNGSVLFMENESKKEYYWALLIDGKIELKIPAKKEDKPNFFELKEKTDFELLYIPELSKEWKKQIYSDKALINQEQTFNFKIPKLVSHDITTKNGYGISLTARDSIFPGDIIELKVGLFKNGKLDGLGYECRLKPYYHELGKILYSPKGNYVQKKAAYKLQSAAVIAKIGLFKEGQLITSTPLSRKINVPNYWLSYDFWSRSEYPGLDGKFYSSNIIPNQNDTYDFNTLKIGDNVFVKKLNRSIPIVRLNYQTKTVELKADLTQYLSVPFSVEKNELYAYKKIVKNYQEKCNLTEQVQKYKDVKVMLIGPSVSTKYSSYTVTGLYYDKVVTTSTSTTNNDAFYITKWVKDGFETKKCSKCYGKGYINRTTKEGYWCPIKYIEPKAPVKTEKKQPELFDRISSALKDTFEKKPAAPLFSTNTQSFISKYSSDQTSNKSEVKKLVLDQVLKLKSEGMTKEQITAEFVKMHNELFTNNKKEYGYSLMMKIPDDYFVISSLPKEQKEYILNKAKESISSFLKK